MDFTLSPKAKETSDQMWDFMRKRVFPAEPGYAEYLAQHGPHEHPPIIEELKAEARKLGLWNLFLPKWSGLSNLDYASIAEISGWSPVIAPEAINCQAPDTGNMETLHMFATPEQKAQWLVPLKAGEIRSAFAMTEPDVASSDATNITTVIRRDGDDYVINGRKWWISGAMNPDAKIFIVMGKTDPTADRHRQQSQILVPRDTPGVVVKRGMHVLGYHGHDHGGHAELEFNDVRVPATNLIGNEGDGFAIAQARLGPGRIHHCMRSIGIAELAIELMCDRASDRVAFGDPDRAHGVVRDWIAESRVRVEQLRLLVLKTAWLMDTVATRVRTPRSRPSRSPLPRRSSGSWTRRSRCMAPAVSARTSRWPPCSPGSARYVLPMARTRSTRTRLPAMS